MNFNPRYIIVADPSSMRWEHYRRDLLAFWQDRNLEPSIQLLDWTTVIARKGDVADLLDSHQAIVRVESPGRDPHVIHKLMDVAGSSDFNSTDVSDSQGCIASPKLIYQGLCHVLKGLQKSFANQPIQEANLDDVALMFDKNLTTAKLLKAEIPCPPTFQPAGGMGAEQLLEDLGKRRWTRAFVKLAYGSCASGIAVVSPLSDPPTAVTTVLPIGSGFFNTFNVRTVQGKELLDILDFILSEEATVQKEIPKMEIRGRNFDARFVMIEGKTAATIFRASSHPMTNLHLGGQRMTTDQCKEMIPKRHWLDAIEYCQHAAELIDGQVLGVDVAFDRRTGAPYVIELNAFGDFFPNWVNSQGKTLHQIGIERSAQKWINSRTDRAVGSARFEIG